MEGLHALDISPVEGLGQLLGGLLVAGADAGDEHDVPQDARGEAVLSRSGDRPGDQQEPAGRLRRGEGKEQAPARAQSVEPGVHRRRGSRAEVDHVALGSGPSTPELE